MSTGVKGMSCTLSHYNTVHAGVMVYVCEDFLLIISNRSTSQNPLMLTPGYQNVYRYQPTVLSLQQSSACASLHHHTHTQPLHSTSPSSAGLAHQGSWAHCTFKEGCHGQFLLIVVLHDWSRRPITFSNSHVAMTNSLS